MALSTFRLPPATHIGSVHLRVASLAKAVEFYGGILGFNEFRRDGQTAYLSASGEPPASLILTELTGAKPKPKSSTGLYHVAVRVPSRAELAAVIERLLLTAWPIHGFADHGVSEAVYMSDADGLGLEIYVDRPREAWPREGGKVQMGTDPLDVENLLKEAPQEWSGIDAKTVIGHVHLQVSDLKKATEFYHGLLGFDITQESYPGALFFSAGGYHHHVAANTWASRGGAPTPEDCVGLESFEVRVPDAETVSAVWSRLEEADLSVQSVQLNGYAGIGVQKHDGTRLSVVAPEG